MKSGGGGRGPEAAVRSDIRITASTAIRLLILLLAGLMLAGPASARRYRRYRTRRATRHHVASRSASAATRQPVRNIILFLADGFSGSHWDTVRASRPDGLAAWDRLPCACSALSPGGMSLNANSLTWLLSTGLKGLAEPLPATLPEMAHGAGRSVAVVSSGAITDPVPAFLAVAANQASDPETLRRLVSQRFEALFARSAPTGLVPGPETYGYRVLTEPQAILMAETVPVLAVAPPDAVPFDTLAFRALHLAARNPKGFMLVVGASVQSCKPEDFNAAVSSALGYARRDKRSLVVVVLHDAGGAATVFADGQDAGKFRGSLLLTDVPKILAGVSGIKGMGRDFSPLFDSRTAKPVTGGGKGIVPLPW